MLPTWRQHLQEWCGDGGLVRVGFECAVAGLVLCCRSGSEKMRLEKRVVLKKNWEKGQVRKRRLTHRGCSDPIGRLVLQQSV